MSSPDIEQRVKALEDEVLVLRSMLDVNTQATLRIDKNTQGLVVSFEALRGFFNVLEFLGKLSKPLFWIGAFAGLVVAGWTSITAIIHKIK